MVGIVLVAISLVLDLHHRQDKWSAVPCPLSMDGHQYHWWHGHQNVDDVEKKRWGCVPTKNFCNRNFHICLCFGGSNNLIELCDCVVHHIIFWQFWQKLGLRNTPPWLGQIPTISKPKLVVIPGFSLIYGGGAFYQKPNFLILWQIALSLSPVLPLLLKRRKKSFKFWVPFGTLVCFFALSIGMTMNAYLGQLALPDSEWRPSEKNRERKISP